MPFNFTAPAAVPLTLKYDGTADLEILNSSTSAVLAQQALANTSGVTINGFASGANSLTVNYSGGEIAVPVTYSGALVPTTR